MRRDELLGLLPRLNYGIDGRAGICLVLLEALFWLIVILLALALWRFRPALLERTEARIRVTSQCTRFWLAGFALIVIAVRLAFLPFIPVPVPGVHDEFSYLLAADTFAHGRLTNPPSSMWVHFESFHINVRPTYQSMYPPGQGLALALGQKLTGVPWFGVLFSVALMCSAIYWMLLGWLPGPWAWLGGSFACVRFGIFSYWVNTYYGGAVAALGGALVLGALPRLRKNLTAQVGITFAAGLLILANSRPLEGFLFSLPFVAALGVAVIKSAKINLWATAKAMLPAITLLILGTGWMLYYNWRGTGNALRMPYEVNFYTYHITKPFFFQKANPIPNYRHRNMRAVYIFWEMPGKFLMENMPGYFERLKAAIYYGYFIWPFGLIIGLCLYELWRSELRVVLVSVAALAADLFAQVWPPQPHYAAPAEGAIFVMVLYSLYYARRSHPEYGVWGSRAVAVVFAAWMIFPIADRVRDPYMIAPIEFHADTDKPTAVPIPQEFQRVRIQSELLARGGKHLVIVGYPYHDIPWREWVYNDADLDNSPVIWARDMGYLENQELLNYYPTRQVWYVDRGDMGAHLVPYERVTAPLKLAFAQSGLETHSQSLTGGRRLASAITDDDARAWKAENR